MAEANPIQPRAHKSDKRFLASATFFVEDVGLRFIRSSQRKSELRYRPDSGSEDFLLFMVFNSRTLINDDSGEQKRTIVFVITNPALNLSHIKPFSFRVSVLDHPDGRKFRLVTQPDHIDNMLLYKFAVAFRDLDEIKDWTVTCKLKYELNRSSRDEANLPVDLNLCDDFTRLLESSEDADVTLVVKGEPIAAHLAILKARSAYFRAMFNSPMEESLNQTVEIDDVEPNVFRGLLRFLYAGQPPENLGEIAVDLLTVADKYGVDSLKELCEARLCDDLDDDNVIDYIFVAVRLNCHLLKDKARVYIMENHRALRRNQENWRRLRNDPDLLLMLFEMACE